MTCRRRRLRRVRQSRATAAACWCCTAPTDASSTARFGISSTICNPRDLLVANNSRVIPARLHGRKATGGAVELFLLRQLDDEGAEWECLVGGKGLIPGATVTLADDLAATITFVSATGTRHVQFSAPVRPYLDELGEIPLPPYITDYTGDRERYQTVYSLPEGSAAAPTAGLHFTPELLLEIRESGRAV